MKELRDVTAAVSWGEREFLVRLREAKPMVLDTKAPTEGYSTGRTALLRVSGGVAGRLPAPDVNDLKF